MFFEQLAIILQSGLPILQGMELLAERSDRRLMPLCYRIHQRLQRGKSLSEAMREEPQFFPRLAVSLVAAGESGGALENVLQQLAAHYKMQEALHSFLVKSLAYPVFLLVATMGVFLFFMLFVLPSLGATYEAMGAKPGGVLLAILQLQQVVVESPVIGVLACCLLISLLFLAGKGAIYKMMRAERFGNIFGQLQEIRFCKMLALLLESGMNITHAVSLIGDTMEDDTFRRQIALLNSRLERGMDIYSSLQAMHGLLSPMTVNLLGVGAATGYLPKMLGEAATIGERDLKTKLMKCKEYLAPLLLAVVAMGIAVVVSVVVGPLLEIITAMPE